MSVRYTATLLGIAAFTFTASTTDALTYAASALSNGQAFNSDFAVAASVNWHSTAFFLPFCKVALKL